MKLLNPLCLALDVDTPDQALAIAQEVRGKIGALKVGPRLTNLDANIVKALSQIALVFVDHKYYDIPSTMEAAIKSAFQAGATFATIHASSGATALKLMAKVEAELNQQRPFRILAVTMLTSFAQEDLPSFTQKTSIAEQVTQLAAQTIENGLTGIVCSPHEIQQIRKAHSKAFIVTPGIRGASNLKDDQKRTMSAGEAIAAGASMLVVGRPIIQAADKTVAVSEILKELR